MLCYLPFLLAAVAVLVVGGGEDRIGRLDGRTVEEALEAGAEPREVWRAVCAEFEVPAERR